MGSNTCICSDKVTTVVNSLKMMRPAWLSSQFRWTVVVGKYSASDNEQATARGNWKKLPQRMTLMPPNECRDGGWPSTIFLIAIYGDKGLQDYGSGPKGVGIPLPSPM